MIVAFFHALPARQIDGWISCSLWVSYTKIIQSGADYSSNTQNCRLKILDRNRKSGTNADVSLILIAGAKQDAAALRVRVGHAQITVRFDCKSFPSSIFSNVVVTDRQADCFYCNCCFHGCKQIPILLPLQIAHPQSLSKEMVKLRIQTKAYLIMGSVRLRHRR